MPKITSTMVRFDPTTHTVWFTDSPRCPAPKPGSLKRVLAGFAVVGIAARAVELAVAATRR